MLRQGNWGLKCEASQDRALKLYPDRRAETSVAAEVVGVEGDEVTEVAVTGTCLVLSVSLSMMKSSNEYPKAHPKTIVSR